MSFNWYALRVRSRHEQVVASSLDGKGMESFLPVYRSTRMWNTRRKELDAALFPGYVFCRFDVNDRLPVLTTFGVVQIVGIGKTPAPVEQSEIDNLRLLGSTELPREPHPFVSVGEHVLVTAGPLRGVEGLLIRASSASRLLLSIKLLHRAVSVEVDQAWVSPVEPRFISTVGYGSHYAAFDDHRVLSSSVSR